MINERDRRATENVLKLDKESYKYKKRIAYRIGRVYGNIKMKKFHDVHNSMYRFLCECELCGQEEVYTACYLKNFGQRCKFCKGIRKDDMKEIQQVIPPQGITDDDFEQAKYELKTVDSYLAKIERLCFEYANCQSMLDQDDGEDDKYYNARMTVALHEIIELKNLILRMYEGKFPGFSQRIMTEGVADGIRQLSGINKDLLGPA